MYKQKKSKINKISYHKISGVGVPSAWQFRIIESPEKKIDKKNIYEKDEKYLVFS